MSYKIVIGIFVLKQVKLNGTLWKNMKECKPGSKWVLETICSHWSHLSDQYSAAGFKSNMTATDLWVKQNRTSEAGVGHRNREWKDQRKRERKGFSSHEDTQDVSQLTFAWLVFFVDQPPTNPHKHSDCLGPPLFSLLRAPISVNLQ